MKYPDRAPAVEYVIHQSDYQGTVVGSFPHIVFLEAEEDFCGRLYEWRWLNKISMDDLINRKYEAHDAYTLATYFNVSLRDLKGILKKLPFAPKGQSDDDHTIFLLTKDFFDALYVCEADEEWQRRSKCEAKGE